MVNIDTVYQRVLALANKEQRGYITPQEFNLYANHAQMDIFEQYFYDLNQFRRAPGNDTSYSDMIDVLQEKIELFQNTSQINVTQSEIPTYGDITQAIVSLPNDSYRISNITSETPNGNITEVEKVTKKECDQAKSAPLTSPTLSRPQYYQLESGIYVNPGEVTNVTINYIRKPKKVNWTYVVVGDKALLNSSDTKYQNFELHASEETSLVVKILQLASVGLKDVGLTQITAAEEAKNIQQEKS